MIIIIVVGMVVGYQPMWNTRLVGETTQAGWSIYFELWIQLDGSEFHYEKR